jgi:tRNA (guanine10-N2)-methyltransferase
VYDPFIGTGSIATALQYFKAFVFGSDLDIRVIKGYGVGRKTTNKIEGLDQIEKYDIYTNFKYYKQAIPDFFVQDVHTPMVRPCGLFDSIVCDPPYGVRARTQKVGISEKKQKILDSREQKHITNFPIPSDADYDERNNFHASIKEQYAQ